MSAPLVLAVYLFSLNVLTVRRTVVHSVESLGKSQASAFFNGVLYVITLLAQPGLSRSMAC